MSSTSPIVRLTAPYCNGLAVSWASNTTLGVALGNCSDSNNIFDISLRAPIVIDTAKTGVNGMDTGTLAASTVYYVHLVGDYMNSNPTAAVLSLSATNPYLPVGYEVSRRIGWAVTDGSTHFVLMYQSGAGLNRTYSFADPIALVSPGSANTFTAIDLSTFVPAIDSLKLVVQAAFNPNLAGDVANIRIGGSSATNGYQIIGQVASVIICEQINIVERLVTNVPTIEYKVAASGAIYIALVSVEDKL